MSIKWQAGEPISATKLNNMGKAAKVRSTGGFRTDKSGTTLINFPYNLHMFQAIEDFERYDGSGGKKYYKGLSVFVNAVEPEDPDQDTLEQDYITQELNSESSLDEADKDSATLIYSPLTPIYKKDRFYAGQVATSGLWEVIGLIPSSIQMFVRIIDQDLTNNQYQTIVKGIEVTFKVYRDEEEVERSEDWEFGDEVVPQANLESGEIILLINPRPALLLKQNVIYSAYKNSQGYWVIDNQQVFADWARTDLSNG